MTEVSSNETKLREQQEQAVRAAREPQGSGHLVWKIVGGAVLALVATGFITSLHDIKRYIRISRM